MHEELESSNSEARKPGEVSLLPVSFPNTNVNRLPKLVKRATARPSQRLLPSSSCCS